LSAVALGAANLHVTCNVPQHQLHHVFSSQLCQHTCISLQVAAAVFAFRGTRLNKTGNLRADLHLLRDLNAEMIVTQRATKKIQNHIKRLQEQQGVKWSFYTAGKYCSSHVIVILPDSMQITTAAQHSEGAEHRTSCCLCGNS